MLHTAAHDGCANRSSSSFLTFKCCVVGDSGVGKTSMMMAFCVDNWKPNKGFIPPTYLPTRPFIIPSSDSRTCITLTIKDTRGSPDADELRAFDCTGADCLLLCFSVVDPESFFNLETRWLPMMSKLCPDAACVLVGTKTDLRQKRQSVLGEVEDSGRASRRISVLEVTAKMGEKLAKKIHAFAYLECSSTNKESLEAVFHAAIRSFTEEDSASSPSTPPPKDKTDSGSGKKCAVS